MKKISVINSTNYSNLNLIPSNFRLAILITRPFRESISLSWRHKTEYLKRDDLNCMIWTELLDLNDLNWMILTEVQTWTLWLWLCGDSATIDLHAVGAVAKSKAAQSSLMHLFMGRTIRKVISDLNFRGFWTQSDMETANRWFIYFSELIIRIIYYYYMWCGHI